MKRGLQASASDGQQPERPLHVATRLDQCGDVLGIAELASVLGLSVRTIEAQEQQRTFPIARIHGLGTGTRNRPRKYAKVAVLRFLDRRAG